ncbi:hypothetical protein E4T56_gene5100 [Termitomyces sp. T112]|nr:hypothetical protein E4T56_gene5100 [Termitomyces sp. T112]
MTLGPLHCTTNALPATTPSSPPPAPTLVGDSQASAPTHPGLMPMWQMPHPSKLGHALRLPHSPTTPPTACWPLPLLGINYPLAGPAAPPPLQTVFLAVPNAPANPAPPMPTLWPPV